MAMEIIGVLAFPIPCKTPVTKRIIAAKGREKDMIFKYVVPLAKRSALGLNMVKRGFANQNKNC